MSKGFMLSKILAVVLFLTSCSLDRNWLYDQSSGLGLTEHSIWVPYDGSAVSVGRFPLYYSTKTLDRSKPTVLFCDGGPGQVLEPNKPGFMDSLSEDFNLVYFHFRGAGLSQFPPSNAYDRYLRTKFAVEDIEQIRMDLKIDRWDAIIGYSYGTVLAQQYAGTYGKNGSKATDRVGKLVLLAPLSRQKVESAQDAAKLSKAIRDKHREVLEEIYGARLNDQSEHRADVLKATDRILIEVDRQFGGLQFVIDEYENLKTKHPRDLLRDHNLDYSKTFFTALRKLRMIGWLPDKATDQENIALIVSRELACKLDRQKMLAERGAEIVYCDKLNAVNQLKTKLSLSSGREPDLFLRDADKWNNDLREVQLKTLQEIYEHEFKNLNLPHEAILNKVSTILQVVQRNFGGLWFVTEKYDDLSSVDQGGPQKLPFAAVKSPPSKSKLQASSLGNHSLEFFRALQGLPYVANEPQWKRYKQAIGVVIVKELATEIKQLNEFSSREIVMGSEKLSYNEAKKEIKSFNFSQASPWAEDRTEKQRANLKKIFNEEFSELGGHQSMIVTEADRILTVVNNNFGSCWDCLSQPKLNSELKEHDLDYLDTSILRALQSLLYINDFPQQKESNLRKRQYVGATIGLSITCDQADRMETEKRKELSMLMPMPQNDTSYCKTLKTFADDERQSSQRVYNVVSAYDGIDVRFLESLPAGNPTDVRTALRKSAGELHFDRCGKLPQGTGCPDAINPYVENVGVSEEKVIPWKPATFLHWVPTLILEGKADPVTAGDQAEDIFKQALRGPRTLIRFPGTGHLLALPGFFIDPPIENRGPCAGSQFGATLNFSYNTGRDCIIASFLKMGVEEFKNARILKAVDDSFRNVFGEDPRNRMEVLPGREMPYEPANKD